MLYIFILIAIIAFLLQEINVKKYNKGIATIFFVIVIFFVFMTIMSLAFYNDFTVKTGTISTDNYKISSFEVNTILSDKTKNQDGQNTIYTYRVSNSNKTISLSLSDRNVHSISVTKNKEVNHLTIKHNTYFDYLTLRTSNEDDYVFSHK